MTNEFTPESERQRLQYLVFLPVLRLTFYCKRSNFEKRFSRIIHGLLCFKWLPLFLFDLFFYYLISFQCFFQSFFPPLSPQRASGSLSVGGFCQCCLLHESSLRSVHRKFVQAAICLDSEHQRKHLKCKSEKVQCKSSRFTTARNKMVV